MNHENIKFKKHEILELFIVMKKMNIEHPTSNIEC